jgi:hypothetical protein
MSSSLSSAHGRRDEAALVHSEFLLRLERPRFVCLRMGALVVAEEERTKIECLRLDAGDVNIRVRVRVTTTNSSAGKCTRKCIHCRRAALDI